MTRFHKYLDVPGSDFARRGLQNKHCPFGCLLFVDTWRCDKAVLDVSCASEDIKSVSLDSSFVQKLLFWRRLGHRIMKLICRCCQNVLGAHRWWWTAGPAGAGVSGLTTRADSAVQKQSGETFGWKTAKLTQTRRSVNTVWFSVFAPPAPPHPPRLTSPSSVAAEVCHHYWSSRWRCDHTHSWTSVDSDRPWGRRSRLVNKEAWLNQAALQCICFLSISRHSRLFRVGRKATDSRDSFKRWRNLKRWIP